MNASAGTKEGDALEEAIGEGVKNVLLVLGDGGYLTRPDGKVAQEEMKSQLWRETNRRLETFLPGLMKEIFPNVKDKVTKKEGDEDKEKENSSG